MQIIVYSVTDLGCQVMSGETTINSEQRMSECLNQTTKEVSGAAAVYPHSHSYNLIFVYLAFCSRCTLFYLHYLFLSIPLGENKQTRNLENEVINLFLG